MIQYPTLSIAGFDNSGGAGLQADLKTFSAFGCYGMTVLTAIAVQNTTGVKHCEMIPVSVIREQLDAVFDDIPPKAVKIGMLFNEAIINTVADFLEGKDVPIVLDPVMMAKSGDPLLLPEARESMVKRLLPLAALVTPNIPEAQELAGSKSVSKEELAQKILEKGCKAVLVKGGHEDTAEAVDLLASKDKTELFSSKRIATKNSHGTGCTLSAAITALLARGFSLEESIKLGKAYLYRALESAAVQSVGQGAGPTDHLWFLDEMCAGKLK